MLEANERLTRQAPGLEREKVVSAALGLLNEAGFESLTLRRLATKLGVKASALYWHFENKQDLINQLAAKIIEQELVAADPQDFSKASWKQLLRALGNGMRNSLSRYRDGALIIAKADLSQASSLKGNDLVYTSLLKHGFSEQLARTSMFAISRFTLGCVFEEQADPRSIEEKDSTMQFEQGLETIIAGVESRLAVSEP